MIEFEVMGPFELPECKRENSDNRLLDIDSLKDFWLETQAGDKSGVYIYARQASKGFVPLYIGETTTAFSKKSFNARNINMLNAFYHDFPKSKLVLFLVSHTHKGKQLNNNFDQVETKLVQHGLKANQQLLKSKRNRLISGE